MKLKTRNQVRAYMSFDAGTIRHMPGFWYYGMKLEWHVTKGGPHGK